MRFSDWIRLSRYFLHIGLFVVAATMFYIFFYTDLAIENGRRSLLLLVPSMFEHTAVALGLVIAGAFAFEYFVRHNEDK